LPDDGPSGEFPAVSEVMKRTRACLFLIALFCLACGDRSAAPPSDSPGDSPSANGEPPAASTAAPAARPESALRLSVANWDETQKSLAAHAGKVVVLDLWSTWCVPCVREFPNLVQLQRQHPDDVVCLSVNLDYSGAAGETPESFWPAVSEFLTKQGATFENVICKDPADDVFQRLKLGSIPAVLVYGPDGQLSKRFDNDDGLYGDEGFTYPKHIVPWVEQLLGHK